MVSQLVQQDGVVSIWWQIFEVMADFTYGQPWTPGHRLQLLLKSQLHKCFKSQRRCRKSRFRWSESNMKPHETTTKRWNRWMLNVPIMQPFLFFDFIFRFSLHSASCALQDGECVVCLDRHISTCLRPCGHIAMCSQCLYLTGTSQRTDSLNCKWHGETDALLQHPSHNAKEYKEKMEK